MKPRIFRMVTVFCIITVILALTPSVNGVSAQNPTNSGPEFNAPNQPTLISPQDGATVISKNPVLSVAVTDPDNDKMSVTFWGREVSENFTIIAIPDTHIDPKDSHEDPTPIQALESQTQWILENKDAMNIVFVTQIGDIVTNLDDEDAWENANNAISILDGEVPYAFAPGNHDFILDDAYDTTKYNSYFGYTRYEDEEWYGGSYPEGTNNNSFQLFTAAGMDFIILHLEISADYAVLEWADDILEEYSDRRAIVVSHSLLKMTNSWTTHHSTYGGNGEETYGFLKSNPNLFLMLCGHYGRSSSTQVWYRTDAYNGNTVYTLRSCWSPQESWLRILEFSPDTDQIRIRTYSPWLDEYNRDEYNDFTLSYGMSEPFEKIGTVKNVKSGDIASITWPGRAEGKEWEWYVTISDGDAITEGSRWRFSTSEIGCENLVATIQGYNLPDGVENSLIAKLQNVKDSLAAINAEKRQDAVNKLQAFINACEAQRGMKLTSEQADDLIAGANAIIQIIQQP